MLQSQLNDARATIDRLQRQVAEISSIKSSVDRVTADRDMLQSALLEVRAQLHAELAKRSAAETRVRALTSALDDAQQKVRPLPPATHRGPLIEMRYLTWLLASGRGLHRCRH